MAQIRVATPADIPELVAMVECYWQFESVAGFDVAQVSLALAQLLRSPALGTAWLASHDGTSAGYLLGVYVFSLEHRGLTAEIDELFVIPEHRNLGIGAELLQEAEREFIRRGCTNVSLQLARSNISAREFYGRLGFLERQRFELLEKTLRGAA